MTLFAIMRATAVLAIALSTSGCWFRKKKPPMVPVITPRQQPQSTPPPAQEPQPETPPQPAPQAPKSAPEPEQSPKIEKPSPAPQQKKRSPRASTPRSNPVPVPVPPPEPEPSAETVPPPAPMPQLGEILTPEKRQQYENEYADCLRRARAALAKASGRALSGTQTESVSRVQAFVRQAEELHGRDISTALQLARRADLLGQDLAKTLQ